MTTISARSGAPSPVPIARLISTRLLHELDEPRQLPAPEGLHRPVVLLEAPGPEVEVDLALGVLDRRPQRPPVLGHQPIEPGPCDPVGERPAVVGRDELVELVTCQVALAPDVAELEARIVVAGVLVVDEADLVAGVDEVAREQVVVA